LGLKYISGPGLSSDFWVPISDQRRLDLEVTDTIAILRHTISDGDTTSSIT
jgi:hypothetical protein